MGKGFLIQEIHASAKFCHQNKNKNSIKGDDIIKKGFFII
jgi:hypothetical protein